MVAAIEKDLKSEIKVKTRKPGFMPNIRIGEPGFDVAALRMLAQNEPAAFMAKTQALIDKGTFRWSDVRDVRRLFLALSDIQVPAHFEVMGETRAIMASAFPLLAGGLTVAGINEAYEAVPTIGQDLVTDKEDNKRISVYAALLSEDSQIDEVREAGDFPEIGAGEETYEIRSKRNGRRISITGEAIEENDVAGIEGKVNALGEIPGEIIEEQTIRRVCDVDGSGSSPAEPYVLRRNKAGASLYSTSSDTPGPQTPDGTRIENNALVDTTDLDNARARLASMLNSRLKRIAIPISKCTLLVPDALAGKALKQLKSELEPGVVNEESNWGPRGEYRPRFRSTPKLDDISTTAWYMGWFERQFIRKWKLRFEYITLSGDTESFLRSRIAFQARVAWDVEIGCHEYLYVVQCLSATSPP